LARNGHLLETGMSKKGVLAAIAVILLLGLVGAGILGWMYISRDRAAVASYRLVMPEGANMSELAEGEAALLKSEGVLRPVIGELDLLTRWKLGSEEEALARLRSKLTVKGSSANERVMVIYRDRSQERALEILGRSTAALRGPAMTPRREGSCPGCVRIHRRRRRGLRLRAHQRISIISSLGNRTFGRAAYLSPSPR